MAKRGRNYDKGQRLQAAGAVVRLRALIARALSRGVCPECGGALHREGDALVCRTLGCGGIAESRFRLACHEAQAEGRL